jgi:hypothetical protein
VKAERSKARNSFSRLIYHLSLIPEVFVPDEAEIASRFCANQAQRSQFQQGHRQLKEGVRWADHLFTLRRQCSHFFGDAQRAAGTCPENV